MTQEAPILVAEFVTADAMTEAVRGARDLGLVELEAHGPYPMHNLEPLLGAHTLLIPVVATLAAIAGGVGTYVLQYWMNAVDYPLNVGGRPLHSWPAFIPACLIVGILASGATTLLGMLVLCRLPRLEHPMFDVPGFERASEDRFFLSIARSDRCFDEASIVALFARCGAISLHEVAA